jgi:hypothetical protein
VKVVAFKCHVLVALTHTTQRSVTQRRSQHRASAQTQFPYRPAIRHPTCWLNRHGSYARTRTHAHTCLQIYMGFWNSVYALRCCKTLARLQTALYSEVNLYEDFCLLGCCTVQFCRYLPMFRSSLLPPSSGLLINPMMEAVSTSEMSVNISQITRCNTS